MGVSSDEISVPITFDGTAAPRIDTESLNRLITMAVRSAGADISQPLHGTAVTEALSTS